MVTSSIFLTSIIEFLGYHYVDILVFIFSILTFMFAFSDRIFEKGKFSRNKV